MTNNFLCVKICIMNTYLKKKTKFTIITILFTLFALCFTLAFCSPFIVKAEIKDIAKTNFLPQSDLESIELSGANAVYCDENITATVENSYLFNLYVNGEKIVINDDISTLNEILDVKLFNDTTLFFSANARLYSYDLQTRTYQKVQLGNSVDEPVSYFDFNQNYLVTTYQATCKIFQITNGAFTSVSSSGIAIADGSNVAINQNNELFIVGNDGIYKTLASLPAIQTADNTLTLDTPSTLIANNDYIFYIATETGSGNKIIRRLCLSDKTTTDFSLFADDSAYQLGNITSPKKISFINDNLLVLEEDCAQEFFIDDEQLIFSGFAIANDKTAYNRILSSAIKVEKVNQTVAVLDTFKLTVFTNQNQNDIYARENYKNYLLSNLSIDGITPSSFALGDGNALLYYSDNETNKFVALLDFSKGQNYLSNKITFETGVNVKDVCYQSGNYYILCDYGQAPQNVYKSTVIDGELSFSKIDNNTSSTEFTFIAVDVYKNIYLANDTTITKLNKSDDYTQIDVVATFTNVTRLQTDLLGNLFVLADGKVHCVNNSTEYSIDNVKTFALDYVDNAVYFIKNDSTVLSSTTQMDNVSILDIAVPSDYTLTNPIGVTTANETLEFFTATEDANAYVVSIKEQTFTFKNLTTYSGEYVKICTVDYLGTPKFLVFANQDDIVLIEIDHAQSVQKQKITQNLPETVFVATNVNAYYLPIINANDDFAFTDTDKVRLNKTTQISVIHKIEFLGCKYYYAQFEFDSKTYSAYIPCKYTVEVLNKDFAWDSYEIETVKETAVYSDNDMQTEIAKLNKNTKVRIIEKGKTVCKIAYKLDDGTYQIGYIYTSKILDEPSIAIRNILVIIAVTACVCGTLTYFILRKRRRD